MFESRGTWLGTNDRFARLRKIEQLDVETHAREISLLFYADFQKAMIPKSFNGFMFNYAATRISAVLASTGEVVQRLPKRIVDTTLLASQYMISGPKEEAGRDAARRINAMHRRYDITPDDYIAVGCEEAIVSLDLAEKYGWREITEKEKDAVCTFYSEQARAFGGSKPMPAKYNEAAAFYERYLETELSYEPHHEKMALTLIDWFGAQVPGFMRKTACQLLISYLDPRIAKACGLKPPPRVARLAFDTLMKLHARRGPPPDDAPNGLDELVRTVYPNGWTFDELGTLDKANRKALPE